MTVHLPLLRSEEHADPLVGLPPLVLPQGDPRPAAGARGIAWAALAVVLSYPDDGLVGGLPTVRAVLGTAAPELDPAVAGPLHRLVEHVGRAAGTAGESDYVRTFDTRRRSSLYLTYYLHGDTRRRGAALWRLKASLAACGFEPTGGELPDHLPVLCELAAVGDEQVAQTLVGEHRQGLLLLAQALRERGSAYADGVDAVLALVPVPSVEQAAAQAAAAWTLARQGPPTETVGLPSWTAPFRRTDS